MPTRWSAAVVVALLVVQVALLVAMSFVTPRLSYAVDQSAIRRSLTVQTLYEATSGTANERGVAAARLQSQEAELNDLTPAERRVFNDFIARPNANEARLLTEIFDERTRAYEAASDRTRFLLRALAWSTSGAALLAFLAFWLLDVRGRDRKWKEWVGLLDRRRQRYVSVFAENPDAMALYRPDGTVSRVNRAAIELYGELVQRRVHWTETFAAKDHSSVAVSFSRALSGQASEFEATMVTLRGMPVPVLCTFVPIRIDGDVAGVSATARDLREARLAEERLATSEARFRSMFDFNADGVLAIAPGGRILRVNVAFERLSGYRTEDIVGKNVALLAPEDERCSGQGFAGIFSGDESSSSDIMLQRADGTMRPTVVNAITMRSGESTEGVYLAVRDVSAERALADRERLQRDRLQALAQLGAAFSKNVDEQIGNTLKFAMSSLGVDAANIGTVSEGGIELTFVQGQGYETGANFDLETSFTRHMFGSRNVLMISDVDEEPWASSLAHEAHPRWKAFIGATIFVDGVPAAIVAFMSRQKLLRAFDAADADFVSIVAGQLGVALARRSREDELASFAYHDPLTGLPNRRLLTEQLKTSLARVARHGGSICVHFIDLDGFKPVNDEFGHAAGDDVLRIVSARLRSLLRDTDSIARIGGDEFVVTQEGGQETHEARVLAERIIRTIKEPIFLHERFVHLNASVGIARAPHNGNSADELLELADQAMYRAKRSGGGAIVFSEPAHST